MNRSRTTQWIVLHVFYENFLDLLFLYHLVILLLLSIKSEDVIPDECVNHFKLVGANHDHRHLKFSINKFNLSQHDNTEEFNWKWFRFQVKGKAERMLELTEMPRIYQSLKVKN